MRIISSIEDPAVIRDILDHLGLWLVKARPPPKIHAPPATVSIPAIPFPQRATDDQFYADPDYSWDAYLQS